MITRHFHLHFLTQTQDCKCDTIDPSCLKCHVTNSTCAEELNCDQHTFIVSENSTFQTSCEVKYNDNLCTAKYNFTQEYLHNTTMVWEYVTSKAAIFHSFFIITTLSQLHLLDKKVGGFFSGYLHAKTQSNLIIPLNNLSLLVNVKEYSKG